MLQISTKIKDNMLYPRPSHSTFQELFTIVGHNLPPSHVARYLNTRHIGHPARTAMFEHFVLGVGARSWHRELRRELPQKSARQSPDITAPPLASAMHASHGAACFLIAINPVRRRPVALQGNLSHHLVRHVYSFVCRNCRLTGIYTA